MPWRIASDILHFLNTLVLRKEEGKRMSWNYRVIRKTTYSGTKTYHSYSIYEVYYNEKGKVVATSEEPIMPMGENVMELMRDIYYMFKAFTHPILEWDLVFRKGLEPTMHELSNTKVVTHDWVPPSKEEIREIELQIDKERVEAEAVYRKECCEKTTKQVFEFLETECKPVK